MTANDDAMSEDDAMRLLRDAITSLPAGTETPFEDPPAAVIDGAKWVHQWLTMEAELAEMTFDSDESRELAGVRSMGSLRELTFVSGEYTIELEIQPGQRTVQVAGSIDPAVDGAMQLVIGGEVYSTDIDSSGEFVLDGVARGTVLAFVDLRHRKLRLGSFEI